MTAAGDLLFVNTSNGVDEGHINLPAPAAPSFVCLDKNTGKVMWTDNSPGTNVLHGQWSSPAYAVLGGVPQVIFGGGDGWLYSFGRRGRQSGKSETAVEIRLQSQGIEIRARRPVGPQPHHRHAGDLRTAWSTSAWAKTRSMAKGRGTSIASIRPSAATSAPTWPSTARTSKTPIAHRRNQAVIKDEGRSRPAEPQFGRRVALCLVRHEQQRQDRLRRNHAPHLRHRGDQGRSAVHRRLQRPVPLSGRQDRQAALDATTCWPPLGHRR